jgi:hypothetical protein
VQREPAFAPLPAFGSGHVFGTGQVPPENTGRAENRPLDARSRHSSSSGNSSSSGDESTGNDDFTIESNEDGGILAGLEISTQINFKEDSIKDIRLVLGIVDKSAIETWSSKKCMTILQKAKEGGFAQNVFFKDARREKKINLNFGVNSMECTDRWLGWQARTCWAFHLELLYPEDERFREPWNKTLKFEN